MENINLPRVVYQDETERKLLKKLCEIASETDRRISNINTGVSLGILVIGNENKDTWIATYRIYHGWKVVISELPTSEIQL